VLAAQAAQVLQVVQMVQVVASLLLRAAVLE
jgi:hypothetical protein